MYTIYFELRGGNHETHAYAHGLLFEFVERMKEAV
jgi:hypothetical protein